mgnify:CR=1 FL=1
MAAEVETMFCTREKPWHGLGLLQRARRLITDPLAEQCVRERECFLVLDDPVPFAEDTLFRAEKYMERLGKEFEDLRGREVMDGQIREYIEQLLPIEEDATPIQRYLSHSSLDRLFVFTTTFITYVPP